MGELGIASESIHPNTIRFAISNLKSQNLGPEGAAKFQQRDGPGWNPKFVQTVQRVYEVYQEELRRSNAVDFDDILLYALRLLQQHPAVTAELRATWHHILVDEWQDTNAPQYALIRMLAAPSQGRSAPSVFVVGDADQSIYGWRGADFTNVERFEEEFAAERVLLEHNYRSTRTIVEAAQHVIERNVGRVDKRMLSNKAPGSPILFHEIWDDQEEASFVARQAKRLVETGAVPAGFRELAVMYRTNQQSRVMEEMFVRNGVPYQLIGATKFYERKEVKDLLAYLRVLANPDDSVSLLRIINTPPRGIGKATIERLLGLAAMWGCSVYQALSRLSQSRKTSAANSQVAGAASFFEPPAAAAGESSAAVKESNAAEDVSDFSVDDLDAVPIHALHLHAPLPTPENSRHPDPLLPPPRTGFPRKLLRTGSYVLGLRSIGGGGLRVRWRKATHLRACWHAGHARPDMSPTPRVSTPNPRNLDHTPTRCAAPTGDRDADVSTGQVARHGGAVDAQGGGSARRSAGAASRARYV